MTPYYVPLTQMLLTRLDTSKTEAFTGRFVRLYHFISASGADKGLGTDFFISVVDQIQAGIFVPLYLKIILEHTPKLARPLDRKTAVISLTKTLADSTAFAETYQKGWALTADALLELLVNPPVPAATDDVIADHDVDDMSFGVGFTPLTTVRRAPRDPWPEVGNVKGWVGEYLRGVDQREGGKIQGFAEKRLEERSRVALVGYMRG